MINIIANNKCILNVDESMSHNLTLASVSGFFNIVILDESDWIQFANWKMYVPKRIINISINELNDILTIEYHTHPESLPYDFDTDTSSMITTFPELIFDCSDRFKHVFGITNIPVEGLLKSDKLFRVQGPMVFIIRCNNMATDMRCCIQTCDTDVTIIPANTYASSISNIVSLNLNTFANGFPFVMSGNSYVVTPGQLKKSEFEIVDIYGNPIQFINDIVWTFNLSKIE